MIKKVLWSIAAAWIGLASPAVASAQQPTTVTGRVRSSGAPLQGALVAIPALGLGGYTDGSGQYTINTPASAAGRTVTMTARRIGYTPDSMQVTLSGGTVERDIELAVAATQLQGVVVTALGVEREKSTLGTAQQQITSEDLNTTKAMNIVQQAQGKISGVNITGSGTQGGSVNIIIRGQNTFASNNQPLFVVDGIPVSNSNRGGTLSNGYDFGNAISDINPEDVETFTVLKGPNAAAIYGSRAQNGAVVITTKKGMSSEGRMRTDFTTSYLWERPGRLPDFQNQYGQGAGGAFDYVNGAGAGNCDGCDQSWGPMLDGRTVGCVFIPKADPRYDPAAPKTYDQTKPCRQFTAPNGGPWVAHPDNVEDFFETGHTATSTLAVSGGTQRANARMSLGLDNTDGFVPNNTFRKVNGSLSGSLEVTSRLSTNAVLQYARNNNRNPAGTGYGNSIMEQFYWFGRQVDMKALKAYGQGADVNNGPSGREYNWNYNYHNNPYYIQNENDISANRDRFMVQASAAYKLLDWLTASARTGSDIFRFNIDQRFGAAFLNGTYVDPSYAGGLSLINDYRNENNSELMLNANREIGSNLSLLAMVGGNLRREYFNTMTTSTAGLSVAEIYNVSNAAITPTLGQTITRRNMNSVFGSAAVTLNGYWTVEGTARNDVSSTLPKGENSYFYPSIATSLIVSDLVPAIQNRVMSYLKLRASYARVGNDADPYQLSTTYSGNPNQFNGQPQFSRGDQLLEPALKPEITRSTEFGIETEFFDGRASLDLSVYNKDTRNQIYLVPVSAASGYGSKLLNAGKMINRGFDGLASVTPIQFRDFTWTTTFNYSRNRNKVAELANGVDRIVLGTGLFGDVRLEATKGQPYGSIWGYGTVRCDAAAVDDGSCSTDQIGQKLIEDGVPVLSDTFMYLGSIQPKWTGGLQNQFTYKRISLGVLLDMRRGGKIMSYSNYIGDYSGVLKSSLRGREIDWNNPGVVARGIDVDTGLPNEENLTAEQYFQSLFYNVGEYTYDASYTKLREIRVGFDFPERWAGMLRTESVSLALVGRNLAIWTDVPNIDPEFAYSSGNFQGIEYAFPGNTRSFGFNIRITP
jgi:TonB-linked SusC/RagA family outer membrane protein